MDEADWLDGYTTTALLNEGERPSFVGGGAIMGPDGELYPIMIPMYRPDGPDGPVYSAAHFNPNVRSLGGTGPEAGNGSATRPG